MSKKGNIRVFISYSHDSEEHKNKILNLAQQLRADGIETIVDQYINGSPPEGWPLWMERQIERSHFVLMVFTPKYLKRFNGKEATGQGLGATWEGAVVARQEIYESGAINIKYIPVLFENAANKHIPKVLRRVTYYRLLEDYTKLLRYLTHQPTVIPVPVGNIKPLPPDASTLTNATNSSHVALNSPTKSKIKTALRKLPHHLTTELFKRQLRLFDDIEAFFKYKHSSTLDKKFAFHQIIDINSAHLLADYARINLGVEIKSKLLDIPCPVAYCHPNTPVILLDSPILGNEETSETEKSWDKYFYYVVHLPKEFVEADEYVASFIRSPILPTSLLKPLKNLLATVENNIEMVRKTLNECALELSQAYPTTDSLKKFHTAWIWNRYINYQKDLMEPAQEILDELRKHLGTDSFE